MRWKYSHEHNIEHNVYNIRAKQHGMTQTQQTGVHYANAIIKYNKTVYELWHSWSGDGHNIDHNG